MRHIIVDGNYQVYRSVFTGKLMYTKSGIFSGGTVIFLRMLYNLQVHGSPIVVFDHSHSQWRKDLHPEYKLRSPKSPQEEEESKKKKVSFDTTFNILKDILPKMGIPVVILEGNEGDDVLFRLGQGLVKNNDAVTAASDDGDFLQFVKEGIKVLQPMKEKQFTKDNFQEINEFNLLPEQFVLWKCLIGDNSDNINGCPGIGPVNATKVVKSLTTPDISGLVKWIDELPDSTNKKKVRENINIIKRNWLLINLDIIPLSIEEVWAKYLEAKSLAVPNYRYVFNKFQELELKSLGIWLENVANKM